MAHFAPFAPRIAGIYEAARDMVLADRAAGRTAEFVDTGATIGGVRQPVQVGAEDVRPSGTLRTVAWSDVRDFDLTVIHDGVDFQMLGRTSAPAVVVIHGRPRACRDIGGWDFVSTMGSMARVRRLVTLWPRHAAYWRLVVPEEKLRVFAAPPVDNVQFSPRGPAHEWEPGTRGEYNVLVADSWREIDPWEVLHGLLAAAGKIPGLRVHTYAVEPVGTPPQVPKGWDHVFQALGRAGVRGEVSGRKPDMDQVYRAADLVASPHVIATRIVAESLCCGTPVLAARGNEFAQFVCDPSEPESVRDALLGAWAHWKKTGRGAAGEVARQAARFSPAAFARAMGRVYEEALG